MVSPRPMETHLSRLGGFCDISKLCSKFTWQLDGNESNDQWATDSIITLSHFHPLPPLFSYPAPFLSLTSHLLRSATVTGKLAAVSNLFQLIFLISSALSLSLGSSCQQRHSFQPLLWPEENLLTFLLSLGFVLPSFCHLSVSVSISSRCCKDFSVTSPI